MAREIVSWCDVCMRADPPVHETGSEVVVAIGKDKPRRIDLCEVHRKEFVDPLQELARDEGVIIDGPTLAIQAGSSGRVGTRLLSAGATANTGPSCPVPDCPSEGRRFKNDQTLWTHARMLHKLGRTEMRALMAEQPTLDGTEPAEPAPELPGTDETFVCGIDGCTVSYSPEKYNRPAQALGVHKASVHGIKGQSPQVVRERARK